MSANVKTALIVGGAAVGAFLLLRTLTPAPAYRPAPSTGGSVINGVTSAIGGLASLAGSLFGGSGGGTKNQGATAADLSRIGFDTGNYTTSNGFTFTDADGTFIAG